MNLKKLFAKDDVTSDEILGEKQKVQRLILDNKAQLKHAQSPEASINVEGPDGVDALTRKIADFKEKGKILERQKAELDKKYLQVKAQEYASDFPRLFADCKAAYLDLDKKTRAASAAWKAAEAANQAFKAARAYMRVNGASADTLLHPVEIVFGGLTPTEGDRHVGLEHRAHLQHLRWIQVGPGYVGSYFAQAVELMANVSQKTPKIAREKPGDDAPESDATSATARAEKESPARLDKAVA